MPNTNTLLQQRYALPAEEQPAFIDNAITRFLLEHRSVRAYQDKPLPEGTLETLLAAAQSAATSSNLQAWSLLAVENPERKARLAALSNDQAHIRQAPLFLVWLADFSRIQRQAEAQGASLEALEYLDSFLVASTDAALAAQNAVLAAESLGLGTVYIGALRNNLAAVIDELGLPSWVYPVFGLAIGYPDAQKPAAIKPRLPQSLVLHRETYRIPEDESTQVQDYDQRIGAFYQQQGLNTPSWTRQSIERLSRPQILSGREHLLATLQAQSFQLR
ncbi:nitroreductase [Azomonas agilis]|uniref:Nitroreductase n=1 Tax=Azomonas agilis TaxID=116849 RepID=A0A562IYJ7_9GAMM|nr:NADPH-dependent oxidoreductase [Azomonas agilis]TWH75920.1 nitroreductase [Azomonas agilis]